MEITDVNTLFGAYPSHHADSDAQTLAAAMTAQQVDYCLAMSTYGLYARDTDGNAETLIACRAHDHLIPVATINPLTYWGQPGLVQEIAQSGFELFRFFPRTQQWPLDFAPFAAILDILAALPRAPLMVETTRAGDITQIARLTRDYPHPVILAGVTPTTLAEAVTVLRALPSCYLETHALQSPDALVFLKNTVGIDRVLFGSGAPGLSLAAALAFVRRSPLTPDEQAAVLGGNAQQIWHEA